MHVLPIRTGTIALTVNIQPGSPPHACCHPTATVFEPGRPVDMALGVAVDVDAARPANQVEVIVTALRGLSSPARSAQMRERFVA
jgi:hypothetical protein